MLSTMICANCYQSKPLFCLEGRCPILQKGSDIVLDRCSCSLGYLPGAVRAAVINLWLHASIPVNGLFVAYFCGGALGRLIFFSICNLLRHWPPPLGDPRYATDTCMITSRFPHGLMQLGHCRTLVHPIHLHPVTPVLTSCKNDQTSVKGTV